MEKACLDYDNEINKKQTENVDKMMINLNNIYNNKPYDKEYEELAKKKEMFHTTITNGLRNDKKTTLEFFYDHFNLQKYNKNKEEYIKQMMNI
jgi:hypothetical protein